MRPIALSPVPEDSEDTDALEAFNTETALDRSTPDVAVHRGPSDALQKRARAIATSLAIALAGAAVAVAGMWAYQTRAARPAPATLALETTPPGAQVMLDGKPGGVTPVSMALAPGTYRVMLVGTDGRTRELEIALAAGASVVRQLEWAEMPSSPPATGTLQIQTDPPGKTVFVDDAARGVSPLTVTDLPVGEHHVVVTSAEGSLRRQVTVAAGQTVSLVIAANSPTVSAGWLQVRSPMALQLRANGKYVGSTEAERLMLPAGEYEIEMANEALGFKSLQRIRIAAGKTADIRVNPPNGTLSVNAIPWAEVWVSGERIGETPIANLSRPIGTHDVVLRHPQFGERRLRVTVTLKETARLGVDLRQP